MTEGERRAALTIEQALAFLGRDGVDDPLPEDDALVACAEQIVRAHHATRADVAKLSSQGLQLSPIWEVRERSLRARLVVRPPALAARFAFDAAAPPLDDAWLDALLDALPWLHDDPIGAAHALEDTHKLWFDKEGPTRALDVPHAPHVRSLTMTLADLARKRSASFTPFEWLASLGLPLDDVRDAHDDPRTDAAVGDAVRARSVAMWAEELGWKRAAFGAGRPR